MKVKSIVVCVMMTVLALASCDQSLETKEPAKVSVESSKELPEFTYKIDILASELIYSDDRTPFNALVDFVKKDEADLLKHYNFKTKGLLESRLYNTRSIHFLKGEWEALLETTPTYKDTIEKENIREVATLEMDAFAKAAMATGKSSGEQFENQLRIELNEILDHTDLIMARDQLEELVGSYEMFSGSLAEAYVKSEIDTKVKASKFSIDRYTAKLILWRGVSNEQEKYKSTYIDVIKSRLAELPQTSEEDLWARRQVTVSEGEEVLIGIWDSGVDPTIMGTKLWVNPDAKPDENKYGLAFSYDSKPAKGQLLNEAEPFLIRMDELHDHYEGMMALMSGVESESAKKVMTHISQLDAEAGPKFMSDMFVAINYSHGQHVADIAAYDLDMAKVMNIRVTFDTNFPPQYAEDEDYARKLVQMTEQSVAFMKKHNVRVANLSWGKDKSFIANTLKITGQETDSKIIAKRTDDIFEIMETGLTNAFKSAPDILFVVAAGNENSDVDKIGSLPGGINLPNVIAVGAVNKAHLPTSFTSYGESVDVYANGLEVMGRIPGGRFMLASGTSAAAPQVTNLAAKIFAVNPSLTAVEAKKIIEDTSTPEGEQNLKVVHPVNAVAKARSLAKQ